MPCPSYLPGDLLAARRAAVASALFCLWMLGAVPAFAQAPKNVLVLTSEGIEMPGLALVIDQAISGIRASSGPVNFYVESLELSRFPTDAEQLVALYKQRYAAHRVDLVIAVCAPALDFALRYRDKIFGDVPILFGFVDPSMVPPLRPGARVSGVFAAPDWVNLIKLALKLHPHVRQLLIVSGTSDFDRGWRASVDHVVRGFSSVTTRYITDLSLRDLLGEVATAPGDALILFLTVTRDASGAGYQPSDVLDMVRRVSPVPVYGPGVTYLGHGVVGGPLLDLEAHGADLARLAARVLAGERPDGIQPITTANRVAFDSRELRRFGIRETELPAGAAVLYREPGFWTFRRGLIIAAVLLLAAQTALIVGLVAQRRKGASLERRLTARLRFETILSEVSAALGGVTVPRMELAIHAALERIRLDPGRRPSLDPRIVG